MFGTTGCEWDMVLCPLPHDIVGRLGIGEFCAETQNLGRGALIYTGARKIGDAATSSIPLLFSERRAIVADPFR